MANDPVSQWQELQSTLKGVLDTTPTVVSEVRGRSSDAADMLASIFEQLRTETDAMNLQMANFAKEFTSPLEEAKAFAKATEEKLQALAMPKTPASDPELPGNLAPPYARQIRERYAPAATEARTIANDDSRVWFDASMVAPSSKSADAEADETRSILANVSNRVAVWWTCVALSDALQSELATLPADERSAIERSVEWVLQPTAAAQSSLTALKSSAPKDSIAAALGSLFGVIGVQEPKQMAGEGVARAAMSTVRLACSRQAPTAAAEIMSRSRDIARDMKAGKRLWTESAGDTSGNAADSLATFSRWTDG